MSRKKNWTKVAEQQFASLDEDIRDDWADLHNLTASRD
jgi:hypothetical protein